MKKNNYYQSKSIILKLYCFYLPNFFMDLLLMYINHFLWTFQYVVEEFDAHIPFLYLSHSRKSENASLYADLCPFIKGIYIPVEPLKKVCIALNPMPHDRDLSLKNIKWYQIILSFCKPFHYPLLSRFPKSWFNLFHLVFEVSGSNLIPYPVIHSELKFVWIFHIDLLFVETAVNPRSSFQISFGF